MRLLAYELRKIWQPRLVAATAVLGALFYFLFAHFSMAYFENGPFNAADAALGREWVAQYGTTMEPEERTRLDGQLADEIGALDGQIAALFEENPQLAAEARAFGITDYATLVTFDDTSYFELIEAGGEEAERAQAVRDSIVALPGYPRVQELSSYLALYDARLAYGDVEPEALALHTPAEQARIIELSVSAPSMLPGGIQVSTVTYLGWLAVWMAIGPIVLLSPLFVRDRLCRVRPLQWVSRTGRRIGGAQMGAGLLSAFALSAVSLALYAVPFALNDPFAFWDCPLYTSALTMAGGSVGFTWFDLTYGQYVLACAVLLLALGVASGAFALVLSRLSASYVAMLLKALPLLVALGPIGASWLFEAAFFLRTPWPGASFSVPAGTEAVCVAALLAASLALCALAARRQTRAELLAT